MVHLEFEHVSKVYKIRKGSDRQPEGLYARLRDKLSPPSEKFWALRDISFRVPQGESLAILGHNGAGKSTILKLLSSITAPSSGRISLHGRLAGLLEVGSGFHPELSGRENVYLAGSILGMRRGEITKKLDAIIDFSGLRKFVDVPVKRYSSGMYVRLGFAIAAHLDPEILLLDEVLAVGDASFQQKCMDRILEMREAGVTIVFISHDLKAAERLCTRALLLKAGEVIYDGAPTDAVRFYQESSMPTAAHRSSEGNRVAEITRVQLLNPRGEAATGVHTGEPLTIRVEYIAKKPIQNAAIPVYIFTPERTLYCTITTRSEGRTLDLPAGPGAIDFRIPELYFQPGFYTVDVHLEQTGLVDPWDMFSNAATLIVLKGDHYLPGDIYQPHQWELLDGVTSKPANLPPDSSKLI